jgi:outer membrane protein insertion porin family
VKPIFLGLRYEGTTIDLTEFSPPRYIEYVEEFGETSDSLALTSGWSRDSRDSLIIPTRGRYQRAFAEVALPVLDLEYYRSRISSSSSSR